MPTYTVIDDAEIAPEQPITTSLMTRLRDNSLAYAGAPTGTKAPWRQSSAPLGWTKDLVHNDKAFRVVTGSITDGGSSPFSTVFGKTATDAYTLVQSNLPNIAPAVSFSGASHFHGQGGQTGTGSIGSKDGGGPGGSTVMTGPTDADTDLGGSGISGTVQLGSSTSFSIGMDIRVQYIDMIIATKD